MISDPFQPPGGGVSTSEHMGPPSIVAGNSITTNTAGGTCNVTATGIESCRFPKLEECAHFHYERVQLPKLEVVVKEDMEVSLHSQHALNNSSPDTTYYTLQVTCRDECWLIQRSLENFAMLDAQLHQCIYDRKVSQLPDLQELKERRDRRKRRRCRSEGNEREEEVDEENEENNDNIEATLSSYLSRLCSITNNSVNCGPILNWFQLDNRGHRLLVPSEESRSINTPAVAAAYGVRRYVSQARDELSLEVGDMISVIDMAAPGESVWWRGKRGFQVGFFPHGCVRVIGDKVPRNMPIPVVGSLAVSPIKPVLRKHGKLITFFRSFILNRPSRRRLKQSGILKERVFGCDLGEHLLNSGHEIPMVLKCCAEFIETHGIVDGIYRLSGVTSNIQKLRNAFDEDRIPNLYTDDILQDIHSVASLLKMYFRELPNPLCTYQLYHSFVTAVQGCSASRNKANDNERLLKMREAVQKLPPPHYRTLEYLMRHLQLISSHGHNTGMTTRNLAIVWAPNLLRCEELEIGGVAALQGVGVQAVVTEFLVCYADLIFSEKVPPEYQTVNQLEIPESSKLGVQNDEKRSRPKSLAISTPTKLLTLEEARNKHLLMKDEGNYIEVGGGPKSLPKKYHTIIELPAGSRKRGLSKRSPSGWRSFFSKSRNSSAGNLSKRDISSPGIIPIDKSITESDLNDIKRKLRPVKSAESLISGQSEPATCDGDVLGPLYCLNKPQGHNRSVSHDSYFDNLQSSQNNSVGSLLDLSEIQLNFELEESEMRIFSEDESLVSSPKVHKDTTTRKALNRARPDDFSSAGNSSNPSPKKQPRVVISPDSLSRKRSRLEDQLSDIQYIDCNTPENNLPCLISTTALVHNENSDSFSDISSIHPPLFEGYQPKNKSPRNSDITSETNRHSLNFEKIDKMTLPKSLTDIDFKQQTPTPGSPNYKPLNDTGSTSTPNMSPEMKSFGGSYENLNSPKLGYENILTISIIYKSPTKERGENIYEDIELNPEKALIPTTVASLPVQEATQPTLELSDNSNSRVSLETTFDSSITTICSGDSSTLKEEIPLDTQENNPPRPTELKLSSQAQNISFDSATKSLDLTYKSFDSLSSNSTPNNSKKSLITPTEEISLSEVPKSSSSGSASSNISSKSSNPNHTMSSIDDLTEGKTVESTLSDSLKIDFSRKITDYQKNVDLSQKTPDFSQKTPDFSQYTPEFSLKTPDFSQNTSDFSRKTPDFGQKHLDSQNARDFRQKTPEFSQKTPDFSQNTPNFSQKHLDIKQNTPDFNQKPHKFSQKSPDFSQKPPDFSQKPPDISQKPSECSQKKISNNNDKRKSCDAELLDENTIYQQVKYFRRSIHEINSLLDLEKKEERPKTCLNKSKSVNSVNNLTDTPKLTEILCKSSENEANIASNIKESNKLKEDKELSCTNPPEYQNLVSFSSRNNEDTPDTLHASSSPENFDSLEAENIHLYENVENRSKTLDSRSRMHESSPKKIDISSISSSVLQELPVCSKCSDDKINVKNLTSKFETKEKPEIEERSSEKKAKHYDKDGLPPCLRAKNAKNSIKTRSLDENAFVTEFGHSTCLQRRKSLDDRTSSFINSKILVDTPKTSCSTTDIRSETQKIKMETIGDPKLNRERIEKYKEERRNFWREKYRSESFKEDKDKLLSRLKQKSFSKPRNEDNFNSKEDINNEETLSSRLSSKKEFELKSDDVLSSRISKIKEKEENYLQKSEDLASRLTKPRNEDISSKYKKEENSDLPLSSKYKKEENLDSRYNFPSEDLSSRLSKSPKEDHPTKKLSMEALSKFEHTKLDSSKFESPKFEAKLRKKNSPLLDRKRPSLKELSDKIMDETTDEATILLRGGKEEEYLRHRRGDSESKEEKNERRRHTYDMLREREFEADGAKRVSLESKNSRKEKCSPSYCIRDMKALFESKSQQ